MLTSVAKPGFWLNLKNQALLADYVFSYKSQKEANTSISKSYHKYIIICFIVRVVATLYLEIGHLSYIMNGSKQQKHNKCV